MYEAPSLPASANVAYRRLDDKTTSTSSSQCVGRRTYVKFKKLGFTSVRVLVYMRYSTTKDESPFRTVYVVDAHVKVLYLKIKAAFVVVALNTICRVFKFKVIKNMFGK